MMASSTRFSKNRRTEQHMGFVAWRWWAWCVAWMLLAAQWAPVARAQAPSDVPLMQLQRSEDGLLLSTSLDFELPALVEDALRKGIPMYFVAEAEVLRERWYWSDKAIAQSARYYRLSYQPLTRRWRLNMSATPLVNSGLGMALGQNFEIFDEALAAMQRIARWKIADLGEVEAAGQYAVQFRFRVDMSQLPRPFQITAVGTRSGWSLLAARSQRLTVENP
jgi:hypothetical protein